MPDTFRPTRPRLRVGVDSGGTFTDVTIYDEATGEDFIWKVSSTPGDPSRGILQGLREAVEVHTGGAGAEVVYFGHGTTVATNALIERRGAVTGLVTTEGFRDVLEIARQVRPGIYDLKLRRPEPLSPRNHRHEVAERMTATGEVQRPLDEASVRDVARRLRADGVNAIAVCLINSYRNPAHEERIGEILREEHPDAFISLSVEIAPEYREFERTSTAVVNSYVGPIIRDYLERLKPELARAGVTSAPYLTQSNGGVISFDHAAAQPVRTILSGPAAGVTGATAIARAAGFENIITFDMGGTSTDVALIEGAAPRMAADTEVHGHPLRVPMLDIETVGAGGGSIACADAGHLLEVGPESAGADPGPACYCKGNDRPTVTDANVLLQVLNPVSLLGGRMPISQAASRAAIARLADRLGVGEMEAATGIIDMAIASMVKAVRVISVERGHDPRDFALMAFGGAGPLHATRLARELGIRRVVVPRRPGVLCSLGLLLSDLRTSFAATRPMLADPAALDPIRQGFAALQGRARDWFDGEGVAEDDRAAHLFVDMRYVGQGHELTIPLRLDGAEAEIIPRLRAAFDATHAQVYGYDIAGEAVQITTLRLEAVAKVEKVPLTACPPAAGLGEDAILATREVYFAETRGFVPCPIYDRERLAPGHVISGPAIVEQMDSTTLILSGQTATIDAHLNIIIEG